MTRYPLPRYFVRQNGAPDAGAADAKVAALHIVDSFFVGNRHLEEREWIVAVDELGNLRATRAEQQQRASLAASLQNELAFNEISRNRAARLIEASEVFLFNLQLVEQPGGSPGWNDPVYLYGTLYGPLPPADSGNQTAGIKGQLTVTRGDLLDGLVQSSDNAFRYGGLSGIEGRFSRCFHLMLAGDTDAEIIRGGGVILAYPLFPPELLVTDVANEIIVAQLLYDLLSRLKEDLELEQIVHPLRSTVLPVVNRSQLERELKSQGYIIESDSAVKKNNSGEGFKGFLASVFGALRNDRLILPPEGDADDFLRIARDALRHFPNGFPTLRIVALRNCLKSVAAHRPVQSPLTPTPPIKTPQQNLTPPTPLEVALPAATQKTAAPSNEPPAWMRDFIEAHRQPNQPPPKLTSTSKSGALIISTAKNKPKAPEQQQPRERLEWTKDFAQPGEIKPKSKGEEKQSTVKPDWMKDFE